MVYKNNKDEILFKSFTVQHTTKLDTAVEWLLKEERIGYVLLPDLLVSAGFCDSKSKARTLITQNAVKLWYGNKNKEILNNINTKFLVGTYIISVGKWKFKKVIIEAALGNSGEVAFIEPDTAEYKESPMKTPNGLAPTPEE